MAVKALSAVEIAMYQLEHCLLVTSDIGTQITIVVTAKTRNKAINHSRREHATTLKYTALTLKAIGRCSTAVRRSAFSA